MGLCTKWHMTFFLVHLYLLAGLGEFRIRDLNDEINKLLREKRHWEERILELGGPDHNVRSVYMYMSVLSSSKSCIHMYILFVWFKTLCDCLIYAEIRS